MSKSRKRIDKHDSRQLSLFDMVVKDQQENGSPRAGGLNIDMEFRELVSSCLKRCQYSRYHVAARMSELAGYEITKAMLDSWTAESKELHRFPAIFLPAFCEAIGDWEIIQFLARKARVFCLPGKEALRADVQKLKEQRSKINKEIKKRETQIEALEEV
ncbi:MAG: hypothetical protein SVY10_10805 [Thermodesulfobacteriota bacterium]|nr:hypothetical protein [Thermodesulfobacteriota bacterium]